jgi:hypothetical protein
VLFQRARNPADIALITATLQQYAEPLHRYLPAHTPPPCYLSIPLPPLSALPHQSDSAPTHLSFVPLPSPRTIQIQHTTAVRRGASWTAAYRRQLTVAAVARPVRGGVGAPGVLAAERSWLLLTLTASAQRSLQPVSSGRASSPWSTLPAGTPRRRSPVSSMRCPPIRSRRPGSGCPAVRCPVTWGWSSRAPAVGRLLSSCPVSGVQLSGVQPCGVQPSGVCPSVRTRPAPPTSGGGGGTRSRWPGDRDHRNRCRPRWLLAVNGSTTVAEAGTRATLPTSRWPVGDRWRTWAGRVGCGPRRPRLPAERPGRPGRRSERPSRAAARWARKQAAARRWRQPRSGWLLGLRDHGGWSSPRLPPGWADPEGPLEVPAGMGVRPQRGPSRQPAFPARCRQHSDLGRWVVGLPGLEPGTSSLSGIEG